MNWEDVEDPETQDCMELGHSDIGGDVLYPVPVTQAQSDALRTLVEYAIRDNWADGYGWITGYRMEPLRSGRTGFPMWFPATIEWIDGSGDFCRATMEFFLEQIGIGMSSYRVCAVVEHYDDYQVAVSMEHLHEYLCDCFGTPLAPDEPGDELTQEWA